MENKLTPKQLEEKNRARADSIMGGLLEREKNELIGVTEDVLEEGRLRYIDLAKILVNEFPEIPYARGKGLRKKAEKVGLFLQEGYEDSEIIEYNEVDDEFYVS